jgi:dihydroneopterin triphosphate diphosphatase
MNSRHNLVTVFVVRPDQTGTSQEFLQLHRVPEDYLGNTWQIVRGTVEERETFLQGALRELQEETGLAPREFYRLGSVELFYTPVDDTIWHSVAFCAVIDRTQQVQLNEEHDAFRWVPRGQFDQHIMWASERALLPDLCRDILDNGIAKPQLRLEI